MSSASNGGGARKGRTTPAERPDSSSLDGSIVVLDRFIQATRDSGYRGTGSAVAELVDNALQADATRIDITITKESPNYSAERMR